MTLGKGLRQLPYREWHFGVCFDIDREKEAKLGLSPLVVVQVFGC
jgi:hypothetical protein